MGTDAGLQRNPVQRVAPMWARCPCASSTCDKCLVSPRCSTAQPIR